MNYTNRAGEQFVDLTEIYEFVPMVTVDDFLKINKFSNMERAFKHNSWPT